jgi:hypothetical protein
MTAVARPHHPSQRADRSACMMATEAAPTKSAVAMLPKPKMA